MPVNPAYTTILGQLTQNPHVHVREIEDDGLVAALDSAKAFMDLNWSKAVVDGIWGLFILDDTDGLILHFSTPKSGSQRVETRVSCMILTLYGFGDYDEILTKISEGGYRSRFAIQFVDDKVVVEELEGA